MQRERFRRPRSVLTAEQSPRLKEVIPDESSQTATPESPELTETGVRDYVAHLAATGRRFEEALSQYHHLLAEQARTEGELNTNEASLRNEQRLAKLKKNALQLSWAVMRHLSSSTIVGVGTSAAAYAFTGDPGVAALAGAGGALTGSAMEMGLSTLEDKYDVPTEYLERFPSLAKYLDKRTEAGADDASDLVTRQDNITALREQLAALQMHIGQLGEEIDELANSGNALFKDPRASQPAEGPTRVEAEEAVRALTEHLRTAGAELNRLLGSYYEMTTLAEGAEAYYDLQKASYDRRELTIEMQVVARKIMRLLKSSHITGSLAALGGIFAYQQAILSQNPSAWAVAGAAAGTAVSWFYFGRLEPKVMEQGKYLLRERLAESSEYNKAVDPELNKSRRSVADAVIRRDALRAEQARLDVELEQFMNTYSMALPKEKITS